MYIFANLKIFSCIMLTSLQFYQCFFCKFAVFPHNCQKHLDDKTHVRIAIVFASEIVMKNRSTLNYKLQKKYLSGHRSKIP